MVDKMLYYNDIIHRMPGHTLVETVVNGETKVELKNGSSVVVNRSQKESVVDAYIAIRQSIVNGESPGYQSTTTERNLLENITASIVIDNITIGRLEKYNGVKWINVSRISNATGITASPTKAQGDMVLIADFNVVATSAENDHSVTLPPVEAGIPCIVVNNGANRIKIFPNTDDDLSEGLNSFIKVAAGSSIRFHGIDSVNWEII